MLKQRTLKTTIRTTGVGLHTGARVELTLRPAAPDTGIVFHRVDLAAAGRRFPADALQRRRHAAVVDARSATARSVSTVEHLMSALAGLGIDNLHVDVAGPEMPIMDGSAGPFVFLLQSAGIVEQAAPKRYLRVEDAGRSRATATSGRASSRSTAFKLDFTIDFPHPVFGSENRHVVIDFAEHSYVKEVARARTFGFMQDVEAMRAAGPGARRQPAERDRAGRVPRAEQRGPALRQRVRQAQGARRDRRPVSARPSADRRSTRRSSPATRSTTRWRARCSRGPRRARSSTFERRADVPRAFQGWQLRSRPESPVARPALRAARPADAGRARYAIRDRRRLLLFLALAAIAVRWRPLLFKRDRRYLRFIWQVDQVHDHPAARACSCLFAFERLIVARLSLRAPALARQRARALSRSGASRQRLAQASTASWRLSNLIL